jgi:hypothetical protein
MKLLERIFRKKEEKKEENVEEPIEEIEEPTLNLGWYYSENSSPNSIS